MSDACPHWCALDPSHDLDDLDTDGRRFRVHRGRAVDVGGRPWALNLSRTDVVSLDGAVTSTTEIDDGSEEPLTSDEARELAHALLAAADVLEAS